MSHPFAVSAPSAVSAAIAPWRRAANRAARAGLAISLASIAMSGCSASSSAPDQLAAATSGTNAAGTSAAQVQVQSQAAAGSGGQATRAAAPAAASGSAGSVAVGAAAISSAAPPAVSTPNSASAAGSSATPAAGSGAPPATIPSAGKGAAGSGASTPAAGSSGAAAKAGTSTSTGAGQTPVYRIPLRLHVGMSKLSDAQLIPILEEMNKIWLSQAGICFEIEVTESEDNRSDGFDFRYTSGRIAAAPSANGVTQSAHEIWSVDQPRLSDAPNPVKFPTARTTAHELGHALGLAHENPPPSTDCANPCYCAMRGDDCDDYLLRSGTMGFFLSPPEVEITRQHAAKLSLSDHAPTQCGMASIQR